MRQVPILGTLAGMARCGEQALLIITMTPTGTATNVARQRIELRCGLEPGHPGPHHDLEHGEQWSSEATGQKTMLLRHEDELG